MNDRLKFRVWDKITKRYFYLELKFGDNGYHPDFIQEPVFEQCTGLKDKTGNLIYEGDLIRTPFNFYGVVKFGKFDADGLGGENANLGFYIDWESEETPPRQNFNYWVQEDNPNRIEIVGNIHERKEER